MNKFKELHEGIKNYAKQKSPSVKDVEKLLKKNGNVPIIMGATDTWGNIDDIEDGIGYGINQFDDDFEIDLNKEKFELAESFNPREDDIDSFVPTNDKDFLTCFEDYVQNLSSASLDSAVSRFGQGMLDYWKDNRTSLKTKVNKILKSYHG